MQDACPAPRSGRLRAPAVAGCMQSFAAGTIRVHQVPRPQGGGEFTTDHPR